ncbi:MAG TPA: tetratricopeptide repeat protein [Frankiaceae bacterium]|nr:tetratricopeptide repeat protein [Frankiaceae bacterium]
MTDALRRAELLLGAHRPAEAADAARAAVAADPDDAYAYLLLAEAYRAAGETDEALLAAQRACALAPGYAAAHAVRAGCHTDRGEPWLAIPAAQDAVRVAPTDPWSHVVLCEAEISGGNVRRARRAAEVALGLDPGLPAAHFAAGNAALAGGRREEAVAAFERVLALDPHDAGALNNLAIARGGRDGPELLLQAVRTDPSGAQLPAANLERLTWAWLPAYAVGCWYVAAIAFSVVREAGGSAALAAAAGAAGVAVVTAFVVRYLRWLPPEVRAAMRSRVRRLSGLRRVQAGAAAAAVLLALPATRPFAAGAAVTGGWYVILARGERRTFPERAVVGPVTPHALAPLRSRVLAGLLDVLVICLFLVMGVLAGAGAGAGVAALLGLSPGAGAAVGLPAGPLAAVTYVVLAQTRGTSTFGRTAAGIAVVDVATGGKPSARQVLGRVAWALAGVVTLGLAWLPVTRRRPALPDRRTGTAVVRRAVT